jgi:hypothetical protein
LTGARKQRCAGECQIAADQAKEEFFVSFSSASYSAFTPTRNP